MADLGEAFDMVTKKNQEPFNSIDYFFSQRTLMEEQEYFDKNMNRQLKRTKITHNFLVLSIPLITKAVEFDIEIFGDEGHYYKGTIKSYDGIIPGLTILIKGDKKIFVHINYTIINNNISTVKKFVNFIDVPKRFQSLDDKGSEISNTTEE